MSQMTRRPAGFTLIELLVVLAILGVLAAIAVPRFVSTNEESISMSVAANLNVFRTAIETYRFQHGSQLPGQDGAKDFADQMTKKTDKTGKVSSSGGYGPYIDKKLPQNPVNKSSDVKVVSAMPNKPTGSEGWVYDKTTGEIRANVDGAGPDGVEYWDL